MWQVAGVAAAGGRVRWQGSGVCGRWQVAGCGGTVAGVRGQGGRWSLVSCLVLTTRSTGDGGGGDGGDGGDVVMVAGDGGGVVPRNAKYMYMFN